MSIYSVITPLLYNAKSNTSSFGSDGQELYAKAILRGQIFDETICWRDNSSEGNFPGGNLPGSNLLGAIFWGDISGRQSVGEQFTEGNSPCPAKRNQICNCTLY